MNERKDVTVPGGQAMATASVQPGKVTVTMDIEALALGFHEALDRLRAAEATEKADSKRLCIPFFEMANWFHSLNDLAKQ